MDIKLNVEIGLSPTLEGFLTRLIGKPQGLGEAVAEQMARRERAGANVHGIGPNTDGGPNPDYVAPAEDPQPEAQRRTRRTKAQIEADEAAQRVAPQQETSSGSATDASEASQGQPVSSQEQSSDLATALGVKPDEPAREGVTAKADVAAKMQEAMAATSPKKVQDRMASDLNGAKRLSEIDPSLYDKAIALYDEMIAGA